MEPLADRVRPLSLEQFAGQEHLINPGKPLYESIIGNQPHSFILWGPPGVGKTTLAYIIAQQTKACFISHSAVLAGVKDIRDVVKQAKNNLLDKNQNTILFIDEVHRFNKAQQDAFLPHIEAGVFTFIGATTENPSFSLNNALLSRTRVYTLKPLKEDSLTKILHQVIEAETNETAPITIDKEAELRLLQEADGDARRLLNHFELCHQLCTKSTATTINIDLVEEVIKGTFKRFDNHGDYFYDQISALHKSVRGSDPDASIYWLRRMLDGGCDPLYIARRLVRIASEDIGNADPRALQIALNAWEAQERLGSPEGELSLAQAISYLACAAKSNAVYNAFNAVGDVINKTGTLDVPNHLRNAPTKLMKDAGHHEGYRYAHNEPEAFAAGETYLPDALIGQTYYEPVERGLEIKISEKLKRLKTLNRQATKKQRKRL